jgi:hypothetical protein
MADEEIGVSLPGGEEPPIILGSGSRMPATPDMSSEGDERFRPSPFTTGEGAGAVKGI